MKRFIITAIFLFCALNSAFSADFGLLLNNKFEFEENKFTYNPGFTPWVSYTNGKGFSLYFSFLLSLKYATDYSGNGSWEPQPSSSVFAPEIARFAVSYREQKFLLEAGRIGYSDILGFTASGLFDGIRAEFTLPSGSLGVNALYTGFQYKETAKITMTDDDVSTYNEAWNFNADTFNNYFASQRLVSSFNLNFFIGNASSMSAEIMAQFDLTGNNNLLHSQYGAVKFDLNPANTVRITFGALFETMMSGNWDFNGIALGALAQFKIDLPTKINDRFGITAKFTTGSFDNTITAFTPISTVQQGMIFDHPLSALANIGIDYNVKIIDSLFADFSVNYFINTDIDSQAEGFSYGGEIWAAFAWQPLDDIRATLGGGVFLPILGDIPADSNIMWKITAGLTISL